MLNIAVLVSGGGTNLQALLDAQAAGTLRSGRITLVVSSKEGAYALTRAQNAGVETAVLAREGGETDAHSRQPVRHGQGFPPRGESVAARTIGIGRSAVVFHYCFPPPLSVIFPRFIPHATRRCEASSATVQ